MIRHMDSIGKYMLEIILHQQQTPQLLKQKKLMQTKEDHSNPIQALNVDSLKVDLVVIQNTCSEKEDSNSETASNKSIKESILDSATKDIHAIKYKMSKAKERCMAYFRSLHSHLQVLSKEDLKGTRIEHGFKRSFISLFGQDADTFTSTMFFNVDQLQKQLDKDEFQEDGSMAAFWVTQESKIDTGKEVEADLVVTKSSGTESKVKDDSSRSGNDTDADDADIRPIYDEELMAEVPLTAECNIFTIGQQHTEQPEIINEGRVDQYPEQCQVKSPMLDSSPDNQTTDYSKQLLESENILLKKTVAQFLKDFSRMEAHYIALELKYQNQALKLGQHGKGFCNCCFKNDLRKLKGNSVDTKFAKTPVLGKPILQSLRNQSVVRQPNAFKSERPQISKPWFASQVDANTNLSRPVTQHYLPKRRESDFAKPDHMIASSESRNSSKNMPRFSSNDMVHNHYVDEAKIRTQERIRNLKSSMMHTASPQSTTKGSKPKPRNNNQTPKSLPIFTRHRFSPNKTSSLYEKTSPRSDLRWKPTGRIFKTIGLRWVPTGKILASCIRKDDSEPTYGSNVDIPNIHESKQTLDLSAGTSINVQKEQSFDLSTEVPKADMMVMTSMIELESLFDPLFNEYSNGDNQVVSKSSVVTTADASDKRQQQPDSTSSTSTLATNVTVDGNFNL
ncbi:hypothetical protein Tco_0767753 [Tanacetum coccineum]